MSAIAAPASAQEETAPAGVTAPSRIDELAGWYEVRLSVPPTTCLTQLLGGEYRAVMELSAGRRGLVLHLERLNAFFQEPIVLQVTDSGGLHYSGSTPVRMGPVTAPVPTRINGETERNGRSFQAQVRSGNSLCLIEGTLSGKRTAAPPAPPPPPPGPGASVFTDGYIAPPPDSPPASINSDGYVAPVAVPPAPVPPSPLINGSYATTLTVTESRCYQDFRGSWQRTLQLQPQPGILIPLQDFSRLFTGPVVLNVEGLRLSQSTSLPIAAGLTTAPVPATFEGVFTTDGARFDVRFQAGSPLCRVRGTISGVRS